VSQPTLRSVSLYHLTTGNSMSVWGAKTKFAQSPGLVCWCGNDERASADYLPVELIHVVHVPVREVRMVAQFACGLFVGAFAEHDPQTVSGQEAPSLSINGVLTEAQNVFVVPG